MLAFLFLIVTHVNIEPSTGCVTLDYNCDCAPTDAVVVVEVTDPVTHHLIDWYIGRVCPPEDTRWCPHVGYAPHFDLHWEVWRASGTNPIEQGDAHL